MLHRFRQSIALQVPAFALSFLALLSFVYAGDGFDPQPVPKNKLVQLYSVTNGSEPAVSGARWLAWSATDSAPRYYDGSNWYTLLPNGGGSNSFSGITSGTNTTAAMITSTGASLTYSGSGTINASSLQGTTIPSSFSSGDLPYANAANTLTKLGIGSTNQHLGVVAGAPAWTTATYPATTTAYRILYSSATNTISEIPTAIDGVLVTDHANGAPSILANGTAGYVLTANSGAPPSWQAASGGASLTAANTFTTNGALSTPAELYTGTWITGGSSTTTKPYFLIETTGTTSNNWSTSGTGLGVNAANAFAGDLINAQVNGVLAFKVNANLLQATADVTTIGKIVNGFAGFSHSSVANSTQYALLQGSSGDTYLNAASGQSITFRIANSNVGTWSSTILTASGGLKSSGNTTAQSTPSNPIGTTDTTGKMMGLAGSITPGGSGKVLIIISGDMTNDTVSDGVSAQVTYGTGSAPTNGAALTGTACGGKVRNTGLGAGENIPFSVQCVVTGLTVSTAYWLDLRVAAITAGTASVSDISISAVEIP